MACREGISQLWELTLNNFTEVSGLADMLATLTFLGELLEGNLILLLGDERALGLEMLILLHCHRLQLLDKVRLFGEFFAH